MANPLRALVILSENDTMFDPHDLASVVDVAVQAEEAGVDSVMFSEHIVLGERAGALGRPANSRDYAAPGNQDPDFPWPSSMVMASAIAARTSRLRLVLAAVLSPLRHPLLLAKEWATLDLLSEGRLVVLPNVSWHDQEYAALGVPFNRRGRILDEQLAVWEQVWAGPGRPVTTATSSPSMTSTSSRAG